MSVGLTGVHAELANPNLSKMHRRSHRLHVGLTGVFEADTDWTLTRFSGVFGSFFRLRVLRATSSRLYKHRSRPIGEETTLNRTFSIQLRFLPLFTRFAITFSFFVVFSIRLHQELREFVVILAYLCPNVA